MKGMNSDDKNQILNFEVKNREELLRDTMPLTPEASDRVL